VDPIDAVDDPTLDAGHARASAARARIEAGQSFSAVAKELSEDSGTKARGGDTGWR
jgi:parvulin-like peptidyl-prolyl isomerase